MFVGKSSLSHRPSKRKRGKEKDDFNCRVEAGGRHQKRRRSSTFSSIFNDKPSGEEDFIECIDIDGNHGGE